MKNFKYLLFILLIIPFNVFADTIPMDNYTSIDNTTTKPIHLNVNGSSSSNFTFSTFDELNLYYNNFNYFGYTICSDSLIQIKRKNNAGSSCNDSCYSNDMYLQLVAGSMMNNNKCSIGNVTNGYLYYFYFGANKWYDLNNNYRYYISDQLTITNLGTSSASIYFYNAIAFNDNPIPNLLQSDTIIDTNSQNTQEIIDNQNQNTQDIIDSNKVCNIYDKDNGIVTQSALDSNGNIFTNYFYTITDFININYDYDLISLTDFTYTSSASFCFFNINKELISCNLNTSIIINQSINIPQLAKYVRFSIRSDSNKPTFKLCMNSGQSTTNAINDVNSSINDMNGNVSQGSIDGFGDFFDDFQDPMPSSVTDILLAPLNLVGSLSNQCSPVSLNVLGKGIQLPCGTDLFWERQFSSTSKTNTVQTFRDIWNVLFGGSIIYALLLKLWNVYESLIDPTNDAKITNFTINKLKSKGVYK